jgi:hypothetical protein
MKFRFFDSVSREERIRHFVGTELLPETRSELLSIIRMLNYKSTLSEHETMCKYIIESDDSFFKNLITKNHVEKRIAEEKLKLRKEMEIQRENERTEFIEKEAQCYISHVIQNILTDKFEDKKYPKELIVLAKQVRERAEKIVESLIYNEQN